MTLIFISTRNYTGKYGMDLSIYKDDNVTTEKFDFSGLSSIDMAMKNIANAINDNDPPSPTKEKAKKDILLLIHGFNVAGDSFLNTCIKYSNIFTDKLLIGFDWSSVPAEEYNLQPFIDAVDEVIKTFPWYDPRRAVINSFWMPFKSSSKVCELLTTGFAYAGTSEHTSDESQILYYCLASILAKTNLNLHILVHSLGSRVLLGALRLLAHDKSYGKVLGVSESDKMSKLDYISTIIFKEADRDYDLFLQDYAYLRKRGLDCKTFNFADAADGALRGSALLHGTPKNLKLSRRLGQINTQDDQLTNLNVTVKDHSKATMFDVGDLTAGFQLRHSYFSDSLVFIPELLEILKEN